MIALIPLSGFLGAGKTTTAISAALALQRTGRRVAVVTNDEGAVLVDTRLVHSALGEAAEIAGGSYSRRFDDLASLLLDLAASGRVDTVIAESVGTGVDLQATVVRPLRRYYGDCIDVRPLTVVVDPLRFADFERATGRRASHGDLAYLFGRQLAEADILAVNQSDLVGRERAAQTAADLVARHPHAMVVPYGALRSDHLGALITAWDFDGGMSEQDVEVDHDRCAAAEAGVAWMNQAFQVSAADQVFDAVAWGGAFLRHLSVWCAQSGALVGHIKVAVRTTAGMAKLSLTEAGAVPRTDRMAAGPVSCGTATVNARVACPPATLDVAVRDALACADTTSRATSSTAMLASFRADRRKPCHRLPAR